MDINQGFGLARQVRPSRPVTAGHEKVAGKLPRLLSGDQLRNDAPVALIRAVIAYADTTATTTVVSYESYERTTKPHSLYGGGGYGTLAQLCTKCIL